MVGGYCKPGKLRIWQTASGKEATVPGGALHPWRRAALPVAAAIGSVALSIAIYLAVAHHVGEHMLESLARDGSRNFSPPRVISGTAAFRSATAPPT